MAGDWIKMRVDLQDDPAVIGIADETGLDEFAVIGRLHKLWSWADRHTLDGNGVSVTRTWVDRFVDCENFAEAMLQVGWLTETDCRIGFPHFDRHNGETAKKRALTNKRVAEYRELQRNGNADRNASCNADSVTESVTREEKRREEKNNSKATEANASVVAAEKPSGDPPAGKVGKINGHKPSIPPCPHEKIIALYHEFCPTLDRVKTWTGARESYSRQRWRETAERLKFTTEAELLGWFREMFECVAMSDFLTGKVPPRGADSVPFKADLEWLLRPKNFPKIIEGRYWNRV